MKHADKHVSSTASESDELLKKYQEDVEYSRTFYASLNEKERFVANERTDKADTMSQLIDNTLLTTFIRRTTEIVAKIPSGNFKSLPYQEGVDTLLDTVWQKYIVPNANTQMPFFEKLWLWCFLRWIYGKSDVLVDYVITDSYIGPDFYVIPPRDAIPEAGKYAVEQCTRYTVRTWQDRAWFERLLKGNQKSWDKDAIRYVLEYASEKGAKEVESASYNEQMNPATKKGIEVLTIYTPKTWTTIVPSCKKIIRQIPNPHQNNELPIVSLSGVPLIDRYHGLSEYDRLAPHHKALTRLMNITLDGVDIRLRPPFLVYADDVVPSTLKLEPGNPIVITSPNPNAIREMQFDGSAINTFSNMYGFLKGALQTGTSTSDTTISTQFDVTKGKTPAALTMQSAESNVFKGYFKASFDYAISRLYDKMITLFITRQEYPVTIPLSVDDVADGRFDAGQSAITLQKGDIPARTPDGVSVRYKFYVDPESSQEQDKKLQNTAITAIIQLLTSVPGAMAEVAQTGKVKIGQYQIDFGELIKQFVATSGMRHVENIVEKVEDAAPAPTPTTPPTQQMPQEEEQPNELTPDNELTPEDEDVIRKLFAYGTDTQSYPES